MRDAQHLKFLRGLPCAMCLAPPPSEAHHSTAHRRGLALKASDHDTFPLCRQCHGDFHDSKGRFKAWGKEEKRQWQRVMVDLYAPGRVGHSPPSGKTDDYEPF